MEEKKKKGNHNRRREGTKTAGEISCAGHSAIT